MQRELASHRSTARLARLTLFWAILPIAFVAVPYCWHRTLSQWIGLGFSISPWSIGTVLLLAVVSVTMYFLSHILPVQRPLAPLRRSRMWIVAFGFVLINADIWLWLSSPLTRDPAIGLLYLATTLWLLWTWLMLLVSWRWSRRLALLLVLLAAVPAFFACVRADGLDGSGRPTLVLRSNSAGQISLVSQKATSPSASSAPATPTSPLTLEHADYPRFHGADGLAVVTGVKLSRDWNASPPKLLWRHSVGLGWSGFAVAGSRAITQEQRGEREAVVCYDLASGKPLWLYSDAADFKSQVVGDGPRATSAIDGERVYTLGATGLLNCIDLASGKRTWSVDILKDNAASSPGHGMCGSPLIVDDRVVVSAGGTNGKSLVAYDKHSGKRAWQAGSDPAGYGSPMLAQLAGVRQILILNLPGIAAHDAKTGRLLWSYPWENSQKTNCSQPVPLAGSSRVLVTTDYGRGCALLELQAGDAGPWKVRPLWTSMNLQTKFCSAVVSGQQAYSLDDGILSCIDLADGRRLWKSGRYGHGQLLLASDLLVIQAESGEVFLVEADPRQRSELARLAALDGKTWNNPALAGRYLVVRNDREAACYELPTEP